MNLAQQKLDRNFEWCCMFKKKKRNLTFLKLLSCIGMKDLGRAFGCVERCFCHKHWLDILCTRNVFFFDSFEFLNVSF